MAAPAEFSARPLTVEAMQVPTDEEMIVWGHLAGWLQLADVPFQVDKPGLIVWPDGDPCWAGPGEWVALDGSGAVVVLDHEAFMARYEPLDRCDLPSGYHDDGDLMTCQLPFGHEPSERHWNPDVGWFGPNDDARREAMADA